MDNGIGSGTFWGVVGVLVGAGVLYNQLVGWMSRKGFLEPYMALAVVGGVLMTLGGVAVLDWRAALLAFLCFAASGAPMVFGSMGRFLAAYRADR